MSFLYPLFLVAGLSLLIPVLIHLFNLRRYKVFYFPHVRFLKNIQLHSRKQSQLRYKWLLTLRLLFLASLILAFAQPFFNRSNKHTIDNNLKVIYIDNSYSMSVAKGPRELLDIAKETAQRQVKKAPAGSRFLIITNDKPVTYQPIPADKALTIINNINISPESRTEKQVLSSIQSLLQSEGAGGADVYYYSDFQKSVFPEEPDRSLLQHIKFYGVVVQADQQENVYIDTAYLTSPVLKTGQSNRLIVQTRLVGKPPKDMPVLQLAVNGQVKSATSLALSQKDESTDTLDFVVNDASWQHIVLSLNDASVRFDDTFRIAARSTPNLSVLVLNEGQTNPYIQAAFRAYNGFRLNQVDVNNAPADWHAYNLIILNGITHISGTLAADINKSQEQGQSICMFPGRTNDMAALNEGLQQIGDIHLSGIDTAVQTATTLQQGSDLVKDLFEKVPDNVQLPVANWHYVVSAGLTANQQSILSFRNGDPLLARYKPGKGMLYICATAADLQAGNFPGSYFFVPFLYQMAVQSRSGDIYAVTAGSQQPVYLSLNDAGERNVVHIYGNGLDVIPSQRPNGAGLDVYMDEAVQEPGFYSIAAANSDTSEIALNANRAESELAVWDLSSLKGQWKGPGISWIKITGDSSSITSGEDHIGFPLWKVCVILALIMLAAETYLLAGSFRKQTIAAQ